METGSAHCNMWRWVLLAAALQKNIIEVGLAPMSRRILLRVVAADGDRCTINAADYSVAFRGDAVDAPDLCCGSCEAQLVIGVDRRTLTNMVIECNECGAFNDTREHGLRK